MGKVRLGKVWQVIKFVQNALEYARNPIVIHWGMLATIEI